MSDVNDSAVASDRMSDVNDSAVANDVSIYTCIHVCQCFTLVCFVK